jgi:quercetin dioxygenase-like cupin family protein
MWSFEMKMDRRQFMEMSSAAMAMMAAGSAFGEMRGEEELGVVGGSGARVLGPEDAKVYTMFGGLGEARLMLNAERTGGARWMGRFREDPGFTTNLHYHPQTDEQVYILEGTLSVYTDGAWHELKAGTLGLLPKGQPHAQGNRSDKPVHFLGSGTPAAFGELFPAVDALMKRTKPGSPEFVAEFAKICERCDIVPIGPAPK